MWAGSRTECYVRREAEAAAAEVYRVDEDAEGVTCVHAIMNSLHLALRPPDTMLFVKFMSADAPCSRWDVAAEYRV